MNDIHRLRRSVARFVAGAMLAAASVGAAAQSKFVYGAAVPSRSPEAAALNKYFDSVEQATGGRLKIERTFDGAVVGARATLPGVRDALVDATFIYDTFFTTELKSTMVLTDLAMLAANPLAQAGATNETILLNCPQCDADFARIRVRPIAYNGVSPFELMCRNPVNSLADLKGKSVRAASAFGLMARAAGAVPVSTVPAEVFEAMQRGQVECAVAGGVWLRSYSLWDVAKHVVDLPLGQYNSSLFFAANANSWKALGPEHRQALVDRLPFLVAEATFNHVTESSRIRAEAQARNVKFTAPSDDFRSFIEGHRKGEIARAISDARAKGIDKPEQLVETFVRMLAKWEKIVAEIGGDRAKYEDALRREIFSKVRY